MDISIHKVNETVAVDFDSLPENVKRYIIDYGLTQSLNDAAAGIRNPGADASEKDKKAFRDDTMAKVEARLDGFLAGRVPAGGGGKRLDPVEVEFRKLVEALYVKALGSKKAATDAIGSDHEMALRRAAEAKGKNPDDVVKSFRERAAKIAKMAEGIDL